MSIQIHGKTYVTVAERMIELREDKKTITVSLTTEVVPSDDSVVIKATLVLKRDGNQETYTGISAANPAKSIEKQSPYEVAETSAVGRALGFAGYGAVDSIASADEMKKAEKTQDEEPDDMVRTDEVCVDCGVQNLVYKVVKFSKSKYDGQVVCYKCQLERKKVSN